MILKIIRLWCLAALLLTGGASAQTFDFSNIQTWVGSGANQAALVVAWYDGKSPDPMVWGYRWTGSNPTMFAMLQAIAGGDPRFSFTPLPQYPANSVYSVFYDVTGMGGAPVVGMPAHKLGPNTETGHAPYPGDHYEEGWVYNGFWGGLVATGNPYNGGSWVASTQGVGDVTISNNSWYALSFSKDETNFTIPSPPVPQVPQAVPAVPEPATICILFAAALVIVARSQYHRPNANP